MLTRRIVPILIVVAIIAGSPWVAADSALDHYHRGVEAKTIGEREREFEQALSMYQNEANELDESGRRNGSLYYNIGNCYFGLGEIGEAIYYYRMALHLVPSDEGARDNLAIALDKRENAYDTDQGGLIRNLLFFHYKLSMRARIDALVGLSLLTSLLLLVLIFKPQALLKYPTILCCGATLCLAVSISVSVYAPRHIGVTVDNAEMRQGAGTGFKSVFDLGEGSSVVVESLDGDWYSVKLDDGRRGFVARDELRLVY